MEANLELSKENHKMITALWKNYRRIRILRFIYLGIIIAAVFGLFYYLDPFVRAVSEIYTGDANTFEGWQDAIKNIPGF